MRARFHAFLSRYPSTRVVVVLGTVIVVVASIQARNTVRINEILDRHEREDDRLALLACEVRNANRLVIRDVVAELAANPTGTPERRATWVEHLNDLAPEDCAARIAP